MSILSIVNEVADVTSLSRFDSVYGSDDPNAAAMLALAKEGGEEISRRADWRDMLKEFTAVLSPTELPEDFQRLIPGGAVRSADGVFFRPVSNGSQWTVVKQIPSAQPYFFLTGSQMQFHPQAAGENALIDYVSINWIKTDGGEEVSDWTSDDDTPLFPERLLEKNLLWRWRRKNGLDFADQLAEFEADLNAEIKANRGV